MFDIKGLKTFAISAKDLNKGVEFYTKVLGGQIVRRVEPTEEQLKAGHVKEVDVRLGNFEVHLFDASKGPDRRPASHARHAVAGTRTSSRGVAADRRQHREGSGTSEIARLLH